MTPPTANEKRGQTKATLKLHAQSYGHADHYFERLLHALTSFHARAPCDGGRKSKDKRVDDAHDGCWVTVAGSAGLRG